MTIKYHNFEQKSPEWFLFKEGKLSASNATPIGANGKGLETYAMDCAMQLVGIEKEHYTNADIERGNELEPLAALTYEFETGLKVYHCGCITNDKYENVCISPDGLIGSDGGCEIKARNDKKHFGLIQGLTSEIPYNQIQMSLLVSERKWWDFISYNPNFQKSLFIKRIYPDLAYFEKLKKGFAKGNELIQKYLSNYNQYKIQIK